MEDNILDGFDKTLSDIHEERELRELLDDESKLWLKTKGIVGAQRSELAFKLHELHNKQELTKQEKVEKLALSIREEYKYLTQLIAVLGVSINNLQEQLIDIKKQLT
jgi:hypothetical protein